MIREYLQAKGQAKVPRDVSLPAVCCSIGQRVDTKQCVFWEDFGNYSEQNGDATRIQPNVLDLFSNDV